MPAAGPTPYDLVAYPSYTHPQTHPDRLAVIGSLFGLRPAPVQDCRVLELGCGNGSNLIPMAWGLPESRFVGVDLAARAVADGQARVEELGLANLRLVQGDVAQIEESWGQFDYIIAHGLYSWVPAGVRPRILEVCRRLLSPQGVAFISYNALPGGHLRSMLREMLLFHVRGFESAQERVRQAMALARFLAEGQESPDPYRLWMKGELKTILAHDEGHLYHDELAEVSEAFSFTQFIEQAASQGLQYLGEADYFEMFDHGFKDSVRETLGQLGSSRILREQYLDFLKCRRFRQTLLCPQGVSLWPQPQADPVLGFWVSSAAKCTDPELVLQPGVHQTFATPKGARCGTDFALGKAALRLLEQSWPMPLAFEELWQGAQENLATAAAAGQGVSPTTAGQLEHTRQQLAGFLLSLYSAGVVEFRSSLPTIARTATERPMASSLARWQARRGEVVTTLFHSAVQLEDEVGRSLLCSLDGTRDRAALLQDLWCLLKSKNALVISNGDESAARRELGLKLEENLAKLARLGLLVS